MDTSFDNTLNSNIIYHQTVIPTHNITHIIKGSFTLPNANNNEVIIIRHNRLELWKLHASSATSFSSSSPSSAASGSNTNQNNNMECIHSMPLFTKVYDAVAVPTGRLVSATSSSKGHHKSKSQLNKLGRGGEEDPFGLDGNNTNTNDLSSMSAIHYLAITSETGYVQLLRYQLAEPPVATHVQLPTSSSASSSNQQTNSGTTLMLTSSLRGSFVKVSEVCLGRPGARAAVPGLRLAVDPQGEALLVSALMRAMLIIPLTKTGVDPSKLYGAVDSRVEEERLRRARLKRARGAVAGDNEEDDDDYEDVLNHAAESGDEEEDGEEGRSLQHRFDKNSTVNKQRITRNTARVKYLHKGVIEFGIPIDFFKNTVNYSICALEESNVVESCNFVVLEEDLVEEKEAELESKNSEEANKESGTAAAGGAVLKLKSTQTTTPQRQKHLIVYSFIFSLRQVQRSHKIVVPFTAHKVIAVPGGAGGPGGVLLCTDTDLIWYDLSSSTNNNSNSSSSTGVFKCTTALPRRLDFKENPYDPSIIASGVTVVRQKYFLILQNEHGDLLRVELSKVDVANAHTALAARSAQKNISSNNKMLPPGSAPALPAIVNPLKVFYFDTIPAARGLVVFSAGLLFAATESAAQHVLYRIIDQGYSKETDYIANKIIVRKETVGKEGANSGNNSIVKKEKGMLAPGATAAASAGQQRTVSLYAPHPKLKHLREEQALPNTPAIRSFIPRLDIMGEGNDGQQVRFKMIGGRGADSTLVEATYGYVVRRESRAQLPGTYLKIISLTSAAEMQVAYRELQLVLGEANRLQSSAAAYGQNQSAYQQAKLNLVRRLLAVAGSHQNVGVDKVVLCTTKDSTVFSIGNRVEVDASIGFVNSEETLAATTLQYGSGYVQVTRRALHILPPAAALPNLVNAAVSGEAVDVTMIDNNNNNNTAALNITVKPTVWRHPHGKSIAAAAVTDRSVLVSLEQGGGLYAFHFDLTGVNLQQWDALPTFPAATAVSLLQHSATHSTQAQLQSILFSHTLGGSASIHSGITTRQLAAVATVSAEVMILDPSRLREPLERFQCASPVESVLLMNMGESKAPLQLGGNGSHSTRGAGQRLFCLVGHKDGTLTRVELDPVSLKLMDSTEVSCGTRPCRLIPGDHQTMCYAQSGSSCWRCFLRDGVLKVVPWIFPVSQTSFAPFAIPNTKLLSSSGNNVNVNTNVDSGVLKTEPGLELEDFVSLATAEFTRELVIGVYEKELSFFSTQQQSSSSGGGGGTGLEYSMNKHELPVAGRQILQHPTRPLYYFVLGNEHRGHGGNAVREQYRNLTSGDPKVSQTIPFDAPGRSPGKTDYYASSIQLFHEGTHALKKPFRFGEGEGALTMAVGSFFSDFGKEPVLVVSLAPQYTHGSGAGRAPSQGGPGVLRTFHCVPRAVQADGTQGLELEPIHATTLRCDPSSTPGAPEFDFASALHICEDVGLLFVGMGSANGLRVYSWGRQQFLRKRQLAPAPGRIIDIKTVFCSPPPSAQTVQGDSAHYAGDIYRCPPQQPEAMQRARQSTLLVVCATVNQSVFVAAMQGNGQGHPSYLLKVAVDTVPRSLTSVAILDERTFAASDRFGHVVFWRLRDNHRLQFSEPFERMKDAELAVAEKFIASQTLQEIACHQTGELVTHLETLTFNPTGGEDASLNVRLLFYATALGSVGVYTPFISEDDGTLASYLKPLVQKYMQRLLVGESGRLPPALAAQGLSPSFTASMVHNVIEGDIVRLLRQSTTTLFTTRAKASIEAELEMTRRLDTNQRAALDLPPHTLPLLDDFIARQRALATLPI